MFLLANRQQQIENLNYMNDKKYESLRKKLDKLGFTQTLNPDSVELVDKIYSQLFKCMNQLDQQRKKKIQNKNPSQSDSILEDRIQSLTFERDSLKKQLQQLRSGNYQKEYDDKIRNLNMLVNSFRVKQEQSNLEYEREVKKLTSDLASLQIKYSQLEKENKSLRSMVADKNNESEKYTDDLSNLIEKKSKQIRQLQQTNSKLRIRVQVLEKSLEDNKYTQRESKQESRNQTQKINNILKLQLAQSENKNKILRNDLQNQRDQTEKLKRDLRRFKEEINILKRDDMNSKNLDSLGKVSKQKLQSLYEESRNLLNQKTEQLKALRDQQEQQQKQRSRLQGKVKELSNKNKHLLDQNADLQTEIQHISAKSTLNIKRVRQLEAVVTSLQKQLKDKIALDQNSSKQSLQKLIREEQQRYEQLRKQSIIKDRDLKLFEEEFKVLKQQAEQRALQRDKGQTQLKKMQFIASEGSRHIETLQLQKQQLMKQNRQLRTGKQLMTSADSVAKSEIFVMREKLQTMQAQNDQLQTILKAQQLRSKELQNEMAKTISVLNRSEQKNKQVFQDNRLMAGQIKILQERKNQLHAKVKDLQQRAHIQMEGDSFYRKQLDQLNKKNQELTVLLSKKDQAIRRIDAQKDQLQNELDQQTQQKSMLKDQIVSIEKQFRQRTHLIDQHLHTINQLERKLSRSESSLQDLQIQYQKLVEEDVTLRDRLTSYQSQLRQLKNQASLLVISHQEAQKEVDRSRNKIAQMDRKMKDKIRENEEQRERATALNILSSQLQTQVERQRAQVVRLRGFVGQLQQANNSMYQQLQRKDEELEYYARDLQEKDRKQDQYIHEINSYQRQLQNLAQDLEYAQSQSQRLSGQRQTLRAERNWKKQVSSLTQDWRTKQQQRYVGVQQDLQKYKLENQRLKVRCHELEQIAADQRVKNCRMSQRLDTPGRVVLVESRVQSYNQSENINNSNVHVRSRNQSLQFIGDNMSQSSESQSVQSAKLSLMQIQRKYMQPIPNLRSN